MNLIFWLSVALIFYAYVGYPFLLYSVSAVGGKEKHLPEISHLPKVSILISAYNEEESIEKKLVNTLDLEYPSDLLEIIVISDGSTDRTDGIVQSFAGRGIILKHYTDRIGKTGCLNRTIPVVKGEIIVFSDANSMYHKDSIKSLVRCFASKKVGFVTGYTRYLENQGSGSILSVGLYSRIEAWTKRLEGAVGSCVCADGAIFAIRRDLYTPLKDHDINDFVIPLRIVEKGYRGLLALDAFCYESTCRSSENEFARQVRITSRTLRAIFGHLSLLNPFMHPMFSFQLISHKLLKFLVPPLLALAFLSNIHLVFRQPNLVYTGALSVQIAFYLIAFRIIPIPNHPALLKISEVCRTFVMVNGAIVKGWIKFFQGETYTTWNPSR